jgi:ATP-binding cassette subfamily B protein
VTQPSELYSLSDAAWQSVLHYLPELADQGDAHSDQARKSHSVAALRANDSPPSKGSQPVTALKARTIRRAYFPSPTVKITQWWHSLIRRYPFFEQQSASDCAAACLVMIGRYWGKRFNVNRLRDLTNVDPTGASLRSLASAAETIGFTARPVQASLNKLAEQQLPAIAHWEGKHYVVVYEVTRKHVVVADPATGQRIFKSSEFKANWTGYVIRANDVT